MKCARILLGLLVSPIAYTTCGQVPVEQRVQQLKDTWYQKAQELADLGAKIIGKNKLVASLQEDIQLVLSEYGDKQINEDGSRKIKEEVREGYEKAARNFYDKLFHAIRDNVNVKGFLIQELIFNKKDFLKKEDYNSFLDRIKLNLLQIVIEVDLTKKLLENYEDCLQKLAEIESELVSLGQPRLYE